MPDDRAVILPREVINELTELLADIFTTCRGLTEELALLEPLVGSAARRSISSSREFLVALDQLSARYTALADDF